MPLLLSKAGEIKANLASLINQLDFPTLSGQANLKLKP